MPTGKGARGRRKTKWRDYISGRTWSCVGVEPAGPSVVVGNREVYPVLLGLLLSRSALKEKAVMKKNQ